MLHCFLEALDSGSQSLNYFAPPQRQCNFACTVCA